MICKASKHNDSWKMIWAILYIVFYAAALPVSAQHVKLPAEWEKQERVYVAWFGKERRDSVLCRVIEALQPSVSLTLNIPADSLKPSICLYLSQ